VTLDGSGSTAVGDTSISSYLWVQTSGINVEPISDDTAESPTFVNPGAATTIVFQLTVTEINGGSSSDSVTIEIT
jgi:hypothetical protein